MSKISNYFAVEKYIRLRFFLLVSVGSLILVPVVLAFANGVFSPRALAFVLIVYFVCIGVAVVLILRNASVQVSSRKGTEITDNATRRKLSKRIRSLQFGVAFLALVLVYALWDSRNDPWPPRLLGASINVLFQAVMIQSIRRMQNTLKQEASGYRNSTEHLDQYRESHRDRRDGISMEAQTFEKVWYLCGDSIWRIFRLLAYQDVGKLTVSDTQLEFKSDRRTIVIDCIRRVSYGKQGRDFVNNWVKIEYDKGGSSHRAFFADGGSHGWDGVLGGTERIFEAVKRLPTVGSDTPV